jgi:hypothetical protein
MKALLYPEKIKHCPSYSIVFGGAVGGELGWLLAVGG